MVADAGIHREVQGQICWTTYEIFAGTLASGDTACCVLRAAPRGGTACSLPDR